MPKVKINSVVKLYTLCLLNNGPKHGYEIIKELENKMNRSISASHVYPFLKSLEDNKFIACKSVEQRDKKRYYLTKNGENFVEVVFSKLDGVIDTVIEKRISTCSHCPCKIYNGGHSEIIGNEDKVFCCSHCAEAFKEKLLLIH
ncbi:MAG: PadR family transcriptional regulator [DPANN group archaeon]|nr:PadR family transcriptional regulator [DPANN group archaeon]